MPNPLVELYRKDYPKDPRGDDEITLDLVQQMPDMLDRVPGLKEDFTRAKAQLVGEPEYSIGERIGQAYGSGVRGITEGLATIPRFGSLVAQQLDRSTGNTVLPTEPDSGLGWLANKITAAGEAITPEPIPGLQDSFFNTAVPQGLGSIVSSMVPGAGASLALRPFIDAGARHMAEKFLEKSGAAAASERVAANMLAKGVSPEIAEATKQSVFNLAKEHAVKVGQAAAEGGQTLAEYGTIAGTGIAQQGVSEYDEAYRALIAKGVDPIEAANRSFGVLLGNIPGGATEAVPLGRMLGRLNRASGGQLGNRLLHIGKEAAVEGIENAVQEVAQQWWANIVARDAYDEGRSLMQDVAKNGEVGGVTGVIASLIISAIGKKHAELHTQKAETPPAEPGTGTVPINPPPAAPTGPTIDPNAPPAAPVAPRGPNYPVDVTGAAEVAPFTQGASGTDYSTLNPIPHYTGTVPEAVEQEMKKLAAIDVAGTEPLRVKQAFDAMSDGEKAHYTANILPQAAQEATAKAAAEASATPPSGGSTKINDMPAESSAAEQPPKPTPTPAAAPAAAASVSGLNEDEKLELSILAGQPPEDLDAYDRVRLKELKAKQAAAPASNTEKAASTGVAQTTISDKNPSGIKTLTPTIVIDGQSFTGKSHAEAFAKATKAMAEGTLDPGALMEAVQGGRPWIEANGLFTTDKGKELTREEAKPVAEAITGKSVSGTLQSEFLKEHGALKHLDEQSAAKPAPVVESKPVAPTQTERTLEETKAETAKQVDQYVTYATQKRDAAKARFDQIAPQLEALEKQIADPKTTPAEKANLRERMSKLSESEDTSFDKWNEKLAKLQALKEAAPTGQFDLNLIDAEGTPPDATERARGAEKGQTTSVYPAFVSVDEPTASGEAFRKGVEKAKSGVILPLGNLLTSEARTSGVGSKNVTSRLVALQHPTDGSVHLVGVFYQNQRGGKFMLAKQLPNIEGKDRSLKAALDAGYRPIASVKTWFPQNNPHYFYQSRESFNKEFSDAPKMIQQAKESGAASVKGTTQAEPAAHAEEATTETPLPEATEDPHAALANAESRVRGLAAKELFSPMQAGKIFDYLVKRSGLTSEGKVSLKKAVKEAVTQSTLMVYIDEAMKVASAKLVGDKTIKTPAELKTRAEAYVSEKLEQAYSQSGIGPGKRERFSKHSALKSEPSNQGTGGNVQPAATRSPSVGNPESAPVPEGRVLAEGQPAPRSGDTVANAEPSLTPEEIIERDALATEAAKLLAEFNSAVSGVARSGIQSGGVNPEGMGKLLIAATKLGLFYAERGIRSFGQLARQIIKDIGDAIRPYLKMVYSAMRRTGVAGLDTETTVNEAYEREFAPRPAVQNATTTAAGRNSGTATGPNVGDRAATPAGPAPGGIPGGNQLQPAVRGPVGSPAGGPTGTVSGTGNVQPGPSKADSSGSLTEWPGKRFGWAKRPEWFEVSARNVPEPTQHVPHGKYAGIDEPQRRGVNAMLTRFLNGGKAFLLADGTGFGKTRQELVVANEIAERTGKKVLIITMNDQILENNFADDAKALGIDLNRFELGTYKKLADGKVGQGTYGLVIYDEAHSLKTYASQRSQAANEVKADHTLLATATPMDRSEAAAYFLAKITDRDEEVVANQLGFHYRDTVLPNGEVKRTVVLNEGVDDERVRDSVIALRGLAIARGAMMRREYPFFGTTNQLVVQMTPEHAAVQAEIAAFWDEKIAAASWKAKRNLSGQKTMELSRWLETKKVDYVFRAMIKSLSEPHITPDGRKLQRSVVIFAEGVNDSNIRALGTREDAFIKRLKAMMDATGIRYSEITGNVSDKAQEVRDFQDGTVRVAIATPQSGGAGINLDDQTGDRPRDVYVVTSNFSGDVFQQVMGRTSRKMTQSPTNMQVLFVNGGLSDMRRSDILQSKMKALEAINAGKATLDTLSFLDDAEARAARGQAPVAARAPAVSINFEQRPNRPGLTFITGDTFSIKDRIASALRGLGGRAVFERDHVTGKGSWSFPTRFEEQMRSRFARELGGQDLLASIRAPFYSRFQRTVEESPQAKAIGAQWKALIKNSKLGASQGEMDLVGVNDLEDGKTYTKQEVLDYLKANEVVVKDVTLGDVSHKFGTPEEQAAAKSRLESARERFANANAQNDPDFAEASKAYDEAYQAMRDIVPGYGRETADTTTHFSTYQLPGAKEGSYREVLLTVPDLKQESNQYRVEQVGDYVNIIRVSDGHKEWTGTNLSPEDVAKLRAEYDPKKVPLRWVDGHEQYRPIPNPIVRLRFNERATQDGKRMLFLEEVQAPQKGEFKKMPALFQKNWREIAFKWALRHAAENGFDSVGWTTGEQQAERYDLSRQIKSITYARHPDGSYDLTVTDLNGNSQNRAPRIPPEKLEDFVGKEVAKQISENPKNISTIEGDNLKVGGEGLKKLYDTDFRNVVNNLPAVRKAGQKVGTADLSQNPRVLNYPGGVFQIEGSQTEYRVKEYGDEWRAQWRPTPKDTWIQNTTSFKTRGEAADSVIKGIEVPIHSLELTPAIRESVMGGQAMFSLRNPDAPTDPTQHPTAKPNTSLDAKVYELEKGVNEQYGTDATLRRVDPDLTNPETQAKTGLTPDLVSKIEARWGKRIIFVDGDKPLPFNAIVGRNNSALKGVVFVNVQSDKSDLGLIGHELFHHLEMDHPDLYAKVVEQLRPLMQGTEFFENLQNQMSQYGLTANESLGESELFASAMEKLFMDPAALNKMAGDHPSLFARLSEYVRNWFNRILNTMRGTSSENTGYFSNMETANRVLTQAMTEFGQRTGRAAANLTESAPVLHPLLTRVTHERQDFTPAEGSHLTNPYGDVLPTTTEATLLNLDKDLLASLRDPIQTPRENLENKRVAAVNEEQRVLEQAVAAINPTSDAGKAIKDGRLDVRSLLGLQDHEAVKRGIEAKLDPATGAPVKISPDARYADFAEHGSNRKDVGVDIQNRFQNAVFGIGTKAATLAGEIESTARALKRAVEAHGGVTDYLDMTGMTVKATKEVRNGLASLFRESSKTFKRFGAIESQIANLEGAKEMPKEYWPVLKRLFDNPMLKDQALFDTLEQVATDLTLDLNHWTLKQIREAMKSNPNYAAFTAGTRDSNALLATVVAFTKTHSQFMTQLEMRLIKDGKARTALEAKLEALKEAKGELSKQVSALAKTASLEERAKQAYLDSRRELRALERKLRSQRASLDALNQTLPIFQKALNIANANLNRTPEVVWGDGMQHLVPKSANQSSEEILADLKAHTETINLRSDRSVQTDPVKLQDQLERKALFLQHREQAFADGDVNAKDQVYARIKAEVREIVAQKHFVPGYIQSAYLWLQRVSGSEGQKLESSLGTTASREAAKLLAKASSIVKSNSERFQRLAITTENAMDATLRTLNRGFKHGDQVGNSKFLTWIYYPAVRFLESQKHLEEIHKPGSTALRTAMFAELRKHFQSNKALMALFPGSERFNEFFDAFKTFLASAESTSAAFNELTQSEQMGIRDERLQGRDLITGQVGAGIRSSLPVGPITISRRLGHVEKNFVSAMKLIGWEKQPGETKSQFETLASGAAETYAADPAALRDAAGKFFNKDINSLFMGPLMRMETSLFNGPKQSDGITQAEASPANIAEAWATAQGNPVVFFENLFDLEGGTGDKGAFVQQGLERLNELSKESFDRVAKTEGKPMGEGQSKTLENMIPGVMIDARQVENRPGEWFDYHHFDRMDSMKVLRQVSAQMAYGRDNARLQAFFTVMGKEVAEARSRLQTERSTIEEENLRGTSKKQIEEKVKANLGAEYDRLSRLEKHAPLVDKAVEAIHDFYRRDNDPNSSMRFGIRMGQELGQLMVQQPLSALNSMAAMFDFFTTLGVTGDTTRATIGTVGLTVKELLQSLGQIFVASKDAGEFGKLGLHDSGTSLKFTEIFHRREGESTGSYAVRVMREVQGYGIAPQGGEHVAFRPLAPFTWVNLAINSSITKQMWSLVSRQVASGVKYYRDNPGALRDPAHKLDAKTLGLSANNADSFQKLTKMLTDYGMDFNELVRDAVKTGEVLNPKAMRTLYAATMDRVSNEGGLATRPLVQYNNSLMQLAVPLLGWAWQRTAFVSKLPYDSNQKLSGRALMNGAMGLAAAAVGGLAVSMLVDWFDEEMLRKKRNLRNFKADDWSDPKNNALAFLERVARIGTTGLFGDLASNVINVGTGQGDLRNLSADQRIIVLSSLQTLLSVGNSLVNQREADWAHVQRPLLQAFGGGGALQYLDMMNTLLDKGGMGPMVQAEADQIKRLTARNWMIVSGREMGLSTQRFSGAAGTPTPLTPLMTKMELAVYANDRSAFMEAYRAAVLKAKETTGNMQEAQAKVKSTFASRNPIRSVFSPAPSALEYRKLLGQLPDSGRQAVTEAVQNFNRFGSMIGVSPYEGAKKPALHP